MNIALPLHSIAAATAERLWYTAVAGTLLAVAVWLVLKLFPRRDPRTNFVVWFATLLATAILPWTNAWVGSSANAVAVQPVTASSHAIFTVSSMWALPVFLAWAAIAGIGLARVVLATLQVRRLVANSQLVEIQSLDSGLRCLIEEFQEIRPLSLRVSDRLEVPTAVGLFTPAIILPAWMLAETPAQELKYTILHELAHLRRRDDWTNLAQKILKALLFFLPSVWWIECRLALDREMACDDAVLAHSGNPRGYAECLAHIAEKSLLRRQMALAQMAVSRMRQLTVRVAKILDPNRQRTLSLWKPAVPIVVAMAALCSLTASNTPTLVRFADATPVSARAGQTLPQADTANPNPSSHTQVTSAPVTPVDGRTWSAGLRSTSGSTRSKPLKRASRPSEPVASAKFDLVSKNSTPSPAGVGEINVPDAQPWSGEQARSSADYVTVREELFVVVTQRTTSFGQQTWQMNVWQLIVHAPAAGQKPVPRKT